MHNLPSSIKGLEYLIKLSIDNTIILLPPYRRFNYADNVPIAQRETVMVQTLLNYVKRKRD